MSPLDRSEALSLLFRGYSARRVAKELGSNNVTVSELLKNFIKEAKEARSVLVAAATYGIDVQVRQLIALGGVVEETKVDASKAPDGLRIISTLRAFGVDPNGVPGFIEAVLKEAKDQHLAPETFVKVAKGLHDLKVEGPRDYLALERDVEGKKSLVESFEKKTIEFEGKAQEARVEMDEALKMNGTTKEELSYFTALRGRLAPHGLDLKNVDEAESCLANIAEQGNDAAAVVSLYSKGVGLAKRVAEQEERAEALTRANADAESKLGETSRVLESKVELVGRVREAEGLGITPLQLGVIVETTRRAGARHGLGVKDSINWLVKDLEENWEPKLGFENEKTRLLIELGQANEKIRLAEGKEKLTMEKVRAHEEALKGLGELRKHVSAAEIIEFKKIIVESGQDVATFRGQIERLGSVTAAVDSIKQRRESEQAKLEGRVTALGAQVVQLDMAKTGLEAEINTINSDTVKALERASKTLTAVADGLRRDFEDPEMGYEARIRSLGEDAIKDTEEELEAKREALGISIDGLRGFINSSLMDVENLKRNTWDTAKLLGFNIHLTRLARLVAGDAIDRVEALATMKMTVDSFTYYLTRNQLVESCPSAAKFSSEIRRIMT